MTLPASPLADQRERLVDVVGHRGEVAPILGAGALVRVDFDDDAAAACHRDGERLRRSHAAEAGREDEPAGERTAEMLPRDCLQELVDALEDTLEADVLPVSGRQAAPHDEAAVTQLVEVLRGRVVADHVAAGHHDQRGVGRAWEDGNRLAGLHDERLVLAEVLEGRHDPGVRLPVPGGLATRRVDDQVLGTLADLEHVLEHPEQPLLPPAPATQADRRAGP